MTDWFVNALMDVSISQKSVGLITESLTCSETKRTRQRRRRDEGVLTLSLWSKSTELDTEVRRS